MMSAVSQGGHCYQTNLSEVSVCFELFCFLIFIPLQLRENIVAFSHILVKKAFS